MDAADFDEDGLPLDSESNSSLGEQLEVSMSSNKENSKLDSNVPPESGVSDSENSCTLDDFTWVPPKLSPKLVHRYMRCLPENKIPYVGSVGDRNRTERLLRQLPVQDCSAKYCHGLSDEEKKELRSFTEHRRKESLGRGIVKPLEQSDVGLKCKECNGNMKPGDMAVFASRVGRDVCWHPRCFICRQCQQLLVDLVYFEQDGSVFCGRHHAELKKPRCSACDELIFTEECIEATGQTWHMKHFTCADCDAPLGGKSYVMLAGRPTCCNCYEASHAQRCQTCQTTIGINQGLMELNGFRWHATDACFRCSTCRESLVGRSFMPEGDHLFCSLCAVVVRNVMSDEKQSTAHSCTSKVEQKGTREDDGFCSKKTFPKLIDNDFMDNIEFIDSQNDEDCENYDCAEDFDVRPQEWGSLERSERNHPCSSRNENRKSGSNLSTVYEEQRSFSSQPRSPRERLGDRTNSDSCRKLTDRNSYMSREEELIEMYAKEDKEDYENLGQHRTLAEVSEARMRNVICHSNDKSRKPSGMVRESRWHNNSWSDVATDENYVTGVDRIVDDDDRGSETNDRTNASRANISVSELASKTKKSVRFDPSTKGAQTPSPKTEERRRVRHRRHKPTYSRDDWGDWVQNHERRKTSGYSSDGALTKPKRLSGYSSDTTLSKSKRSSDYAPVGLRSSFSERSRNKRYDVDEDDIDYRNRDRDYDDLFHLREVDGDDIEKCSTCSSSSDSSDFFEHGSVSDAARFYEELSPAATRKSMPSLTSSQNSRTLPSSSRVTFAATKSEKNGKKKKHKKTNCIVS